MDSSKFLAVDEEGKDLCNFLKFLFDRVQWDRKIVAIPDC